MQDPSIAHGFEGRRMDGGIPFTPSTNERQRKCFSRLVAGVEKSEKVSELKMIGVGVVGYGYWGPNVARNFSSVEGSRVVAICDLSKSALGRARQACLGARLTSNPEELFSSKDIDAVAIVTPA